METFKHSIRAIEIMEMRYYLDWCMHELGLASREYSTIFKPEYVDFLRKRSYCGYKFKNDYEIELAFKTEQDAVEFKLRFR